MGLLQGHWKTFRGGAAKSKQPKNLSTLHAGTPENMIVHPRTWKVWWCQPSTLTIMLFREKQMSKKEYH